MVNGCRREPTPPAKMNVNVLFNIILPRHMIKNRMAILTNDRETSVSHAPALREISSNAAAEPPERLNPQG